MRIVDRATFLAMPAGTIFTKFKPIMFDDLCRKEDSLHSFTGEYSDFVYTSLTDQIDAHDSGEYLDKLSEAGKAAVDSGTSTDLPLEFDCTMRDGEFDNDQLFCVWDKNDIKGLIAALLIEDVDNITIERI